jgi:hypothetical protein
VSQAAVLLRDGRVLLAGGWDESGVTASALLYDPRTGRIAPTGSMRAARGAPAAVRLRDGRVLVVGGSRDGGVLRSAELYDPRTGRFASTGSMAVPRGAFTVTLLRDGRVLVVGGDHDDRVLASAELYDPRRGRFVRAGRLRVARHKHGAALLPDGRVLVVGGSSARDFYGRYATAEIYDPRRNAFVATRRLAHARFKLSDAVVPVPGGVLVAGGDSTVELFDAARDRFRTVGRIGARLAFSTATVLRGGDVLVAGGYDDAIAVSDRGWLVTPR